ncbi:hypothetical protein Trydic_g23668 [Trypoxylus dichotomus]
MKRTELLLVSIFLYLLPSQAAGCTISLNRDITEPQPLVLTPGGGYGNSAFFLPSSGDTISLAENQLVDIACPNGNVLVNGGSLGSSTSQARCTGGRFVIGGQNVPFTAITCSVIPAHTARFTGSTCLSNYRQIEIGFAVGSRFLRIMSICFDQSQQNSLYSEFNLTRTIGGYQVGYPRPSWLQGSGFFSVSGVTVDTLYTRNRQRTTINGLLGLSASSYQYIAETSDLYLARGHLTAKADFLYGSQQRATFYFVNAAPQWQTFNGQNWNNLEQNVRDFASRQGLDLIVYTGTYGITTLPHATTGQDTELFLYVSGSTRAIPVPRLFWKVVYNPATKAGVVFIGVNNPYVVNSSRDIICTNVCNQFNWLTWKASDVQLGYSYCCSVPDFRRTVTTFPNIEVTQLLR